MTTQSQPSIQHEQFGQLPDGQTVDAWTLTGAGGLELEVLTYGGIVRRLLAPGRNGEMGDVVLGYTTLEAYRKDPFFMGATIGRIAGRVTHGKLNINNTIYNLPINDSPNHLHGGPEAFNTKIWLAEPIQREDGAPSLKLTYHSPSGQQGYPGAAKLSVIYTVSHANEFVFETFAETDQATPISMTHHAYFNLSGEGCGTILDHQAQIFSTQIAASDAEMTLLNRLEPIDGTAADMRQPTRLGEAVPKLWQQHGDLYWLGADPECRRAARIEDPASGRVLEVSTTCSCLQTYFAASMDGSLSGKSGKPYQQFGAFCMECEGYPEATNAAGFGNILVHPSELQHTKTIYTFSTTTAQTHN